jgi:hypothetical protein
LHYDKIESIIFKNTQHESAIFLEDDFILGQHYLKIIDSLLRQAIDDPRIGYVSAVGDHLASIEQQRLNLATPIMMKQNWAFGLTRRHWQENQPIMEEYISLISNIDYRQRPHDKIFDLYSRWGVGRMESSQDHAKFIATTLNKRLRLSTAACYGKYIGETGIHSSPELYRSSGYDRTQICDIPVDGFDAIDDGAYQDLLSRQVEHLAPSPQTLSADGWLHFKSGSADCVSLGVGFHAPEDRGVWMSADTAVVSFLTPIEFAASNWELEIELRHFLPDSSGTGVVTLTLDDHFLGTISSLNERKIFSVATPGSCFSERTQHELVIRAQPLARPTDYGSTDPRILGASLSALRFKRI